MAEPQATSPDDQTPAADDPEGRAKHVVGSEPLVESPGAEFVTGVAAPTAAGSASGAEASGAQSAAAGEVAASPSNSEPSPPAVAASMSSPDGGTLRRTAVAAKPETSQPFDASTAPTSEALPQTTPPVAAQTSVQQVHTEPVAPVAASTERPQPRKRSNRLFATGMVLLSALLFEVLYLAAIALLIVVLSGPSQVVPGLQSLVTERLVWVPLVIFVVLYELLVILFNRAGRFVYVVASLIVGLAVYLGSVVIVVTLAGQTLTQDILRQVLISPEFALAGIAAREVMLWTGFAIGAHGKRLRRKNREARDEYEHELADA